MAPNKLLEYTPSAVFGGLHSVGKRVENFKASKSQRFYEQNPQVCVYSVRQRRQEVVIDIEQLDSEAEMSSLCRQPEIFQTPLDASMQSNLILTFPDDIAGNRYGVLGLAAGLQYDISWYSTPPVHQADAPKGYNFFPETPWLPSELLMPSVFESQKRVPVFNRSIQPVWSSQPFDFNNLKGGSGRGVESNVDTISRLFANINPLLRESPVSTSQWAARDFRLTPMPCPQLITEVVPYYIELLDGWKDWQPRLNPSHFRVTMIKPHGLSVSDLAVRPDERGLSFVVTSNQTGYHKIIVLFVAPGQKPEEIIGSPLNIKIINPSQTPRSLPSLSFRQPVIDFKPWGFAEHRLRGLIYVTETYYSKIHVINLYGLHQFVIELDHTKTTGLCRPTGIAVCENTDRLYVSDKDNHRVLVLNWDGDYIAEFGGPGIGEGQFSYPWGIAISPDGTLLAVADTKNKRVQLFDARNLQYVNKYSMCDTNPSEYQHLFHLPGDLLFDETGLLLYVSDFSVHSIIIINVSELTQRFFTRPIFTRPQGMCWDLDGNLLVADMGSGKVVALDRNGNPLERPQSWKDIQTPVNVLQLRNGFVLAVTERFGIVTLYDPR